MCEILYFEVLRSNIEGGGKAANETSSLQIHVNCNRW